MRHARSLLALLPIAAVFTFACEDSSPETPVSNLPDAGAEGGDPSTFDAPATGPVRVTVAGEAGPLADVLVVFSDAAGATLETKTTGADGKASSSGVTPAMVSVRIIGASRMRTVTWTAVEAGDELSVSDRDTQTSRGSYEVSLAGLFDGATNYTAQVGRCSTFSAWNGQAPTNLGLYGGCVQAQNAVLVTATDVSGIPLAHAFAKGVAAPASVSTPLAVAAGPFAAASDVTVSQTNAPAGPSPNATVTEIVGDVAFTRSSTPAGAPLIFKIATGFADAIQASVISETSTNGVGLVRRAALPVAAGTFAFDFATALPRITTAAVVATDPSRPEVTWASAAPIVADGGLVRTGYQIGGFEAEWTFVVPSGATSVKAPVLPATDYDAGGASYRPPYVLFIDADLVPDYRTFRRQPGTLMSTGAIEGVPPLPAPGTMKITYSTEAG